MPRGSVEHSGNVCIPTASVSRLLLESEIFDARETGGAA
jgi:hypothetical protein